MIKRQGEYYICEEDEPQQERKEIVEDEDREYKSVGDIKERLNLMRERVNAIKAERAAQQPQTLKLSDIYQEKPQAINDYLINLSIPSQLLSLEERIEKIEEKISFNEIQRQGIEKGGNIVERVKKLQKKLEDMIKNKSIEVINQNINQYSSNLDEKQENFKQLYLYEIFNKTQGLGSEIEILEKYLESLSKVQRTVNSMLPTPILITTHNEILTKREEISAKVGQLFTKMRKEYAQLLTQIDTLDI